MKILYISGTVKEHTNTGGYFHISKYPGAKILDVATVNDRVWKLKKPWKCINYLIADRIACKESSNFDIIHCTYEDNYFFPFIYRCKCKSIGTVHLDITKNYNLLKKILLNFVLKKLDLIVVLSQEQQKKLSELGYNSIYIPHGYNKPNFALVELTDFNPNMINIFFSGNTYRDIDLLEEVVAKMNNRNDVLFHILSQKGDNKNRFMKYNNVKLYDRVSDDEYFTLLSQCDYNFLPLTFATANNTLLEAHTLGKISILPKEGGILDYASDYDYLYSDKEQLIQYFENICKNTELCKEEIIKFSEDFTWNAVYEKLSVTYQKLLGK